MNIQDPIVIALCSIGLLLLILAIATASLSISLRNMRKEVTRYEKECAENYRQSFKNQTSNFENINRVTSDLNYRVNRIETYLNKPLYNIGEIVEWWDIFGTIIKGEIISILDADPSQGMGVQYNVEVLDHSHPTKVYKTISEHNITAWY